MADKQSEQNPVDSNGDAEAPGFIAVMFSVIAAAFGVQSQKNRERDFKQGSFLPYIIGGILFTVVFVAALLLLVRSVLSTTGG